MAKSPTQVIRPDSRSYLSVDEKVGKFLRRAVVVKSQFRSWKLRESGCTAVDESVSRSQRRAGGGGGGDGGARGGREGF